MMERRRFVTSDYFYIILFLVSLNFIILGLFSVPQPHIYFFALIQIVIVFMSIYAGTRGEDGFIKKSLISSGITILILAFFLTVIIYLQVSLYCDAGCSFGYELISWLWLASLYTFLLNGLLVIYMAFVTHRFVDFLIVIGMMAIVAFIFIPTLINTGCLKNDLACFGEVAAERHDSRVCSSSVDTEGCVADYITVSGKEMSSLSERNGLTRTYCDSYFASLEEVRNYIPQGETAEGLRDACYGVASG